MTAGEIIEAMGGSTALAQAIGASRSAVSNWPRAGIPAKYWLSIARHAAKTAADGALPVITLEVLEHHALAKAPANGRNRNAA